MNDLVAAHALDVFSKYFPLSAAQPKNPQEVWGGFSGEWLGTYGPPKCIQMNGGGDWEDEIRTAFCAGRRVKLQFPGVGAHPLLLGRRKGLARGIYNRLSEDGRFMNKTILAGAQWCLNAMLSASGCSASRWYFVLSLLICLDGRAGART